MFSVVTSIFSLLLGIGILLIGIGLLGTLLGLRAGLEHFSDAVTGIVMSAYFLGYILGTLFCPAIIRRVGHIRAFAAMAAIASTATILHGLLVHPLVWGLLRVITGICMVGLYIVVESWLNSLAPHHNRGRMFAAYLTVTLLAMSLGQFLILLGNVEQFTLFAVVSALITLALVPVALTTVVEPRPVEAPKISLYYLYSTSPLGVVGTLIAGFAGSAFWGMGAVFAQGIGMSQTGIATFMSATVVGGALLQGPIGHLSDRHDRRSVLTAVAIFAASVATGAFIVATYSQTALILAAFLYGGLSFSVYGLSVARINDFLEAPQVLEATRGLLLIFGVGATLGPAAGGLCMNILGPKGLLAYFAIIFSLLSVFAIYRMQVRRPIPIENQTEFVPMVRTSQVALEMDPRSDLEPEFDLKSESQE